MSTTAKPFDAAAILKAAKPTAAESKVIESTLSTIKYLEGLKESARPSNGVHHIQKKDDAHAAMLENPTPVSVDAYLAALGQWLAPKQIFTHLEADLSGLVEKAERSLAPVAKRLLSAGLESAQDAKQFGLAEVEKIADIEERGAKLVQFAANHRTLLAEIEASGAVIDTRLGAINWLTQHGHCDAIYA